MSELLEGINKLTKSEALDLLTKIIKRVKKEEKMKEYTGKRSASFCGEGRCPRGKYKGNGLECVKKGFGVGKAMGIIDGVNKERDALYRLIERKIS